MLLYKAVFIESLDDDGFLIDLGSNLGEFISTLKSFKGAMIKSGMSESSDEEAFLALTADEDWMKASYGERIAFRLTERQKVVINAAYSVTGALAREQERSHTSLYTDLIDDGMDRLRLAFETLEAYKGYYSLPDNLGLNLKGLIR